MGARDHAVPMLLEAVCLTMRYGEVSADLQTRVRVGGRQQATTFTNVVRYRKAAGFTLFCRQRRCCAALGVELCTSLLVKPFEAGVSLTYNAWCSQACQTGGESFHQTAGAGTTQKNMIA